MVCHYRDVMMNANLAIRQCSSQLQVSDLCVGATKVLSNFENLTIHP